MSLKFKPVVAFDVDGVLRVDDPGSEPGARDGFFCERIAFRESEWPAVFHGQPRWVDGEYVCDNWFSSAGVELLRKLVASDDVDVVWATTWQGWANTYFGELFGVGELPVAVVAESYRDVRADSSPEWKVLQLAERFPARPLLWLDDNLPSGRVLPLEELRRPVDRALTKSHGVNFWSGITEYDSEEVLEWVRLASSAEGHKTLRESRRELVADRRRRRNKWAVQYKREREVANLVKEKVLALFPGEDKLARELSDAARHKYGLSTETIQFALMRNKVEGDAAEIREKIRVPRYHLRRFEAEQEELLDF